MAAAASLRPHALLADTVVEDHTAVAMVASLIPIPLAEFAAISAVHMKMVEQLAGLYKVEFKPHLAKSFIASLLTAYVSTATGTFAASSLSKLIPGLGSAVSVVTMPPIAGALTYAMGRVFIRHFEAGGTLQTMDEPAAQASFLLEVKQGNRR